MSIIQKILITPIRWYKKWISPLLPPSCRFYPTCSTYMMDAINMHGAFKGTIMGIARLLRCNPFVKGGIDYVPLTFSLRRNLDPTYHGPYTKEHLKELEQQNNEQKK